MLLCKQTQKDGLYGTDVGVMENFIPSIQTNRATTSDPILQAGLNCTNKLKLLYVELYAPLGKFHYLFIQFSFKHRRAARMSRSSLIFFTFLYFTGFEMERKGICVLLMHKDVRKQNHKHESLNLLEFLFSFVVLTTVFPLICTQLQQNQLNEQNTQKKKT